MNACRREGVVRTRLLISEGLTVVREQNCAVLLHGAELGPMEFTEADFGST